jgi:hypothetical protein
MTFLEQIQAHTGGLVRLKTELYWYGSGYDNTPGRVCLILDSAAIDAVVAATGSAARRSGSAATTLLLINGSPQWIWIAVQDTELL